MQYRPARLFASVARFTFRAALGAVITVLIFAVCLTATLSYLGLPLPDPYELLEHAGSVSQLAKILS